MSTAISVLTEEVRSLASKSEQTQKTGRRQLDARLDEVIQRLRSASGSLDVLRFDVGLLPTSSAQASEQAAHAEANRLILQTLRKQEMLLSDLAANTDRWRTARAETDKIILHTLRKQDQLLAEMQKTFLSVQRSVEGARGTIDGLERASGEIRKSTTATQTSTTKTLAMVDAIRNSQDSRDRQQTEWAKKIAQMFGNIRSEIRLILEDPSKDAGDNDPDIIRRYIEGSRIRELYPTDVFPALENVSLPIAATNEESGHQNHMDLIYVSAISQVISAKNIFEFGTYQGRTTYYLTFSSPEAHVYSLNLPPEDDPEIGRFMGVMFKGTDRESRITQILENSFSFDPEPYRGVMDFIFVDADHSYEAVKNDTEKALIMLRPGGVIVWHDYAAKSPGVVRYMSEFSKDRPVFRLRSTCLTVYRDGVDAMLYTAPPRRPSLLSR